MSILKVVVDREEFRWSKGGAYQVSGWKAVEGKEKTEIQVSDENGKKVEAFVSFGPRADVCSVFPQYRSQEESLGFTLTVPGLEDFLKNHQELKVELLHGLDRKTLKVKTGEELKNGLLDSSIRFYLDEVRLFNGEIRIWGWMADVTGENSLKVLDEDGKEVGVSLKRLVRRDVNEAMDLKEDALSGFMITMPRKAFTGKKLVLEMKNALVVKRHEISMEKFDYENSRRGKLRKVLNRERLPRNFSLLKKWGVGGFWDYVQEEILDENERYLAWLKKQRPSRKELQRQRRTRFPYEPLISIVIPLYNTPQEYLRELLESIKAQTYEKFELCLADGSTKKGPGEFVKRFYGKDERFRYRHLSKNGGISENTNAAIAMALGEFLLFADHDDLLEPDALFELVKALNQDRSLDILYTDEDLTDAKSEQFHSPRFKPDFNLDFLRSINYICHIFMVRRTLAEKAGLLRKECDGAQDFDFILRCCERTEKIFHIPKILYHWRAHEESTAGNQDSKQYAIDAGLRALKEHYERLGYRAEVTYTGIFIMYQTVMEVQGEPLVSILIPNKDQKETLKTCLDSIYEESEYKNFEILILENNSEEEETFSYYHELEKNHPNLRVLTWEGGFNYSAINNFGAREAKGDFLLFLNNDVKVITPSWITQMLGYCQREGTGIVGAKLYYPDDTVQHAGVVIGLGGFAGHVQNGKQRKENGYFGRLAAVQDVSAVTAACMLVKREVFEQAGGFDEDFVVALNDVDLCLKVRAQNQLVVFNPNVELYHYESKSRGFENTPDKKERFKKEILLFRERWGKLLEEGDPYYNPNMTIVNGECTLKRKHEVPQIWEELFPERRER